MIPFLYVALICLAAFYMVIYAITFIMLILGYGDEVMEEQRQERVRFYNAIKNKR